MADHLTFAEFSRIILNPMIVHMVRAGRLDDGLCEVQTSDDPEIQRAINERLIVIAEAGI